MEDIVKQKEAIMPESNSPKKTIVGRIVTVTAVAIGMALVDNQSPIKIPMTIAKAFVK